MKNLWNCFIEYLEKECCETQPNYVFLGEKVNPMSYSRSWWLLLLNSSGLNRVAGCD
jgi:hypothetical protein